LQYRLVTGTGTDQNVLTGFTGQANAILQTPALTATWQRFTATATLGASISQMAINFVFTPTSTASTNDYYEVTGVQIDLGSVALPFRTNSGTLQGELQACQRYYYRSSTGVAYQQYGAGIGKSTTVAGIQVKLPITMRTVPSSTIDAANLSLYDTSGTVVVSSVAQSGLNSTPDVYYLEATTAGGLTQFRPYILTNSNSTSAYIGFSAEL